MIIWPNKKCIHLTNRKCYSGSIFHLSYHGKEKMHCLSMHLTLKQEKIYKNIVSVKDILKNYTVSVILRNPWEHAVSMYYHVLDEKRFYKENFFNVKNFFNMSNEEKFKTIDVSFDNFVKTGYSSKYSQDLFLKRNMEIKIPDIIFNFKDKDKIFKYIKKVANITSNISYHIHSRKNIKNILNMSYNIPYIDFYNDDIYSLVEKTSTKTISMIES